MIDVIFYTIDKDERSTKRPTGGTTLTGDIKDKCGVTAPHFLVNASNPSGWNYAYIAAWQRYYWVRDWIWTEGLWECVLFEDVLGTYKTEIGNSTEYVVRAFNGDGAVIDSRYVCTAKDVTIEASGGRPFLRPELGGTYCLATMGKDSSTGPCYYLVDPINMRTFTDYLFEDNGYLMIDTDEISDGLQKALYNPIQYVVSCVWYPFTVSNAGSAAKINFGWWEAPATGRYLPSGAIYTDSVEIEIPKNPLAAERGIWTNIAPYARYELFFRPFGTFQLDTTLLAEAESITCEWHIDLTCGNGTLVVETNNGKQLLQVPGMVGVPTQLAQMARNPFAAMQMQRGVIASGFAGLGSVVGGAASLISGDIAGGVSSIANIGVVATNAAYDYIESSAKAQIPSITSSGSQGSRADLYEEVKVVGHFAGLPGEDREHAGRPLCKMVRIGSLSGYVLVSDPKIAITGAYASEMGLIKQYMSSGFYYE